MGLEASIPPPLLLLPLFFLSPLLLQRTNALPREGTHFEAIYQFGDSISDTGNAIRDPTRTHTNCGKSPYGETFFHRPTGRCSDGLLMIDFFAQALGLPFLSPYLDKNGNFSHGVNFAVGGATALDVSTLATKNIPTNTNSSLSVQLDWFKSHLNTICATPSECKRKLEKALFIVGEIGGNDYNFAAYGGRTAEDLRPMVPEVVQAIVYVIKEVVDLGAKRIFVPGNFPVGCMTVYLAKFRSNDQNMFDELSCLINWNDFARFHNDQLQVAIKDLQEHYLDVDIVYGDYFSALRSILKNAPSLGFDEAEIQKACCGISANDDYNFDKKRMCGSIGTSACSDPNKSVSWDGIHLTQHAYQLMANWLLPYIIPTPLQVA